MDTRVQLRHPEGKKAVSMANEKYTPLKNAILAVLKQQGVVTQKELMDGVLALMQARESKFEGSVPWHTEWVKLDLEARREIVRQTDCRPATYALPK